jgi:hypothetical protein
MKHDLKCWPAYFQATWVGAKDFEIRKNDRNFKVHDEIVLSEYDPKEDDYTDRQVEGVITYITDFKQRTGYVVFNYRPTGRTE